MKSAHGIGVQSPAPELGVDEVDSRDADLKEDT
jgi:hypothetical protein